MPYLCLMQEGFCNLPEFIEKAGQNNFSVVASPINHDDMPLEFTREPLKQRLVDFTYPDLLLTPDLWNNKVISILSQHVDCDSEDLRVRQYAEDVLLRDISWAEHIQYSGYMLLKIRPGHNTNLARIVTNNLKGTLLVQVPLYNARVAQASWRNDINEDQLCALDANTDPWQWWHSFRWAADFHHKVKVVLELNEGDRPNEQIIRRWLGEPLEAVIIPTSLFILNRHNYPVLPKAWQNILTQFLQSNANLIVSGNVANNNLKNYADYLINFRENKSDAHELKSFEDVLEIPLQPLFDNLDCYTYEVFEKDPVKYKLYQLAIEAALIDRVPEESRETTTTVVMILGAGRGPLVRSALNASENTKRKIRVYIIEKNPNAIRTLNAITKKLWNNKDVHLFSKDMRQFQPPEKADIIVSELLGSFGDNELSPECLDCAQLLLKPDGISIPYKSTSFINPIMSSKLLNAVRNIVRNETFGRDKQATYHTHAESGFVTLLKNIYNIGLPQQLFEFVHPNTNNEADNRRYKTLSFVAELDCVVTGIAGYFESALYKNIILSINPETHTPGMHSWFPMFFPFSHPIEIKRGQTVTICFWRCVSTQKIWYEWCMVEPNRTHVHNLGGRSCPIYCT